MLAEAQGMQSLATGVATLNSFVQSCRMESYNCTASTQQAFLDEIWFQRRIELWGEGFSYFDMMRFQKDLDRVGAGYDVTLVYQVSANDPVLIYEIIQSEAENNPLIGNVSNGAVKPDAVADK
jgi:imidazole glycerol phosphate synthase subunit HisF